MPGFGLGTMAAPPVSGTAGTPMPAFDPVSFLASLGLMAAQGPIGKIKNKGLRKGAQVGTGAASGALAGTAIAPGPGTAIGAGLGALMSIFA